MMLSCSISARMWISFSMSFMATPLLDVSTLFFLMYLAAYSVRVDFSITRCTTANSPLKKSEVSKLILFLPRTYFISWARRGRGGLITRFHVKSLILYLWSSQGQRLFCCVDKWNWFFQLTLKFSQMKIIKLFVQMMEAGCLYHGYYWSLIWVWLMQDSSISVCNHLAAIYFHKNLYFNMINHGCMICIKYEPWSIGTIHHPRSSSASLFSSPSFDISILSSSDISMIPIITDEQIDCRKIVLITIAKFYR